MRKILSRRALLGLSSVMILKPFKGYTAQNRAVSQLSENFQKIQSNLNGSLHVAACTLDGRWSCAFQAVKRAPLCSTFKLILVAAVLQHVEQQGLCLSEKLPMSKHDILSWAPVSRAFLERGAIPLDTACAAALQRSDNTAANLLLQLIGGPRGWTHYVRQLGDDVSRLDRVEPQLNDVHANDVRDTTTALAMQRNLRRLFYGDALSLGARAQLREWTCNNRFTADLMQASVGRSARVYDKSGAGDAGARGDIGIICRPNHPDIIASIYIRGALSPRTSQDAAIAATTRSILAAADIHFG